MDEGWTNWLLQDFDFDFTSLFNKDMKASSLAQKYDVIIIPDDSVRSHHRRPSEALRRRSTK